jgi:hypothetical protein
VRGFPIGVAAKACEPLASVVAWIVREHKAPRAPQALPSLS